MPNFRASVGHNPSINVKRANPITFVGQEIGLTVGVPGGWQLAAGHFMPAKMVPTIIHPRPNAETNSYARCRLAPSGIPWELRVVVLGGAWPFKYELTTGPSGAVMTRETLPTDWLTNGFQGYGRIGWTAPTVGTHSFAVRVTDQSGTQATVSWTLTVVDRENTTNFMFLNPTTGNNANSGAFSSPRQTMNGWYESDKNGNSAHSTKQIFYRGGTYSVLAIAGFGGQANQADMVTGKPEVHIGYPGETVTWNFGPGCYIDWESSGRDICLHNLTWTNPETGVGGHKAFLQNYAEGAADRTHIDKIFLDGGGTTPSADSTNSAAIMIDGQPSAESNYVSITDCTFYRCSNMDLVLYYNNDNSVFEGNFITGGYQWTGDQHSWGVFIKGQDNVNYSIRANVMIDGTINLPFFFMSEFTGELKGNVEVCWNNLESTGSVGPIALGQGSGGGGNYGPMWAYRNNLRCDTMEIVNWDNGPFYFEENAVLHDGTQSATDGLEYLSGTVATDIVRQNNLSGSSGILDLTTNLLTGASRTSSLGLRGCEVA